jgi:nucleotidyltransferase substrate binding protein (TIGR01987 family)
VRAIVAFYLSTPAPELFVCIGFIGLEGGFLSVSFQLLDNAIEKLSAAIARPKDEFIRDSVIQRFEFCVELSWKVSKRIMGTSTTAPKDVVREMAQNKLISDVKLWLEAIDMRNLSSHTYNEELAEKVYGFAVKLLPELKTLRENLKSK